MPYTYGPRNKSLYYLCKKSDVTYTDIDMIIHSVVLTRKAVVWVEFGANVGAEFGGHHPAII